MVCSVQPGTGSTPSFEAARDIFVETVDTTYESVHFFIVDSAHGVCSLMIADCRTKQVVPLGTHKPWAANYNVKIKDLLSRCMVDL